MSRYDRPLEFNPCLECGSCVSVCPVGAVRPGGGFDFTACYSHNYRERLGGFGDWIEKLTASKSPAAYRKRVTYSETISMWQNLAIGPQTKCDRCMAVCPAGEEIVGEFLEDRRGFIKRVVKRFKDKKERIYVVHGSDAENHVLTKFPHKTIKRISNGLRPDSIRGFLGSLPLVFQPGQAEGLAAVYHFTFSGEEEAQATVTIRDRAVRVEEGLQGRPDLRLWADSRAWLSFLTKEMSLVRAVATRKIRVKGSLKLMGAFGRCFPG